MKNLIFLFIIASLNLKGGIFSLKQKEAILGEPVIIEVNERDFATFPITAVIQGPNIFCVDFNEERINLVNYFKVEGEYEIRFSDEQNICKYLKEINELKEKLEKEEDERERGYLEWQIRMKELINQSSINILNSSPAFIIKIKNPTDIEEFSFHR